MDDGLPPVKPGFVRIALLLTDATGVTPGTIAKATGVAADDLGPIMVTGHEAHVDVREAVGQHAREHLQKLGATQLLASGHKQLAFQWLKVCVGRNHGLTMGQLRKILDRAKAAPVGRIHINNTHCLIGLRDDRIVAVEQALASVRINGIATRPERPAAGSIRESAAYSGNSPKPRPRR